MGSQFCLNTSATLNSNMKFLVLFACVAAASAVELVTYPSGAVAPAKTPEVLAAEHAHFAAKGAYAYPYGYAGWNGYYGHPAAWAGYNGYYAGAYGYPHGALVAPVVAAPYAYAAGYPYAVAGLVAHPNGAVVPVEPADVVAAREEHLAAHAAAQEA